LRGLHFGGLFLDGVKGDFAAPLLLKASDRATLRNKGAFLVRVRYVFWLTSLWSAKCKYCGGT
jgi:hypothetical protein